tara:strand:+ start:181 stop:357 length:177 start_codon:yes stop_codon:yes gene_type:complete
VEKKEVQRLLNLRSFLIEKYEGLSNARHATTINTEVASTLEKTIKDVDKILSTYVNFD